MRVGIISGVPPFDNNVLAQLKGRGVKCEILDPESPMSNLLRKINRSDTIYRIHCGFYLNSILFFSIARMLKKRVVLHWVGSDVLISCSTRRYRLQTKIIQKFVDLNLVVSPNLAEELEEFFGVKSSLVPFVFIDYPEEIPPLPTKFRVLSYQPKRDPEFYGSRIVNKLAKKLPEIEFVILGRERREDEVMKNMSFRVHEDDIRKLYKKTSVLLRITPHDGIALMVKEALGFGRQVIFSHPHPHCHPARDYEEVKKTLLKIKAENKTNIKGYEYILANFDKERAIDDLIEALGGGERS